MLVVSWSTQHTLDKVKDSLRVARIVSDPT